MSLRWTAYTKWPFSVKNALHLKKSATKFLCEKCEYCQRQSCKAFTVLSIRAKMVGGRCPRLYVKIWPKLMTHRLQKRRFPINIRGPATANDRPTCASSLKLTHIATLDSRSLRRPVVSWQSYPGLYLSDFYWGGQSFDWLW